MKHEASVVETDNHYFGACSCEWLSDTARFTKRMAKHDADWHVRTNGRDIKDDAPTSRFKRGAVITHEGQVMGFDCCKGQYPQCSHRPVFGTIKQAPTRGGGLRLV